MTNHRGGLYDGFEGYRTPNAGDYYDVFHRGLVVLDTNVLLDLYRYNRQARDDLLNVMEQLDAQLWLPFNSIQEFWRNRNSRLDSPKKSTRDAIDKIKAHRDSCRQDLNAWANKIALSRDLLTLLQGHLDSGFSYVETEMTSVLNNEQSGPASDTNKDSVLLELERILFGKVGAKPSDKELAEVIVEFQRRVDEGIPPGYRDSAKSANAHGDYLTWWEILREARSRSTDVLFVTRDEKDDWWRKESGMLIGPRLELAEDLRREAGTRLYLLTPERFLQRARDVLKIAVSEESLESVRSVQDANPTVDSDEDEASAAPWTSEEIAIMESLDSSGDLRQGICKLPEGRSREYVQTLRVMIHLADDHPSIERYLDRFQEEFEGITNRSEARRRASLISRLGLAIWSTGGVELTETGHEFLASGERTIVQDAVLNRIRGARELRDLANLSSASKVRANLRWIDNLSPTQSYTILRWLEQLDLVKSSTY